MELGNVIKPKKDKIPRTEQAYGRIYKISELENATGNSSFESYLP